MFRMKENQAGKMADSKNHRVVSFCFLVSLFVVCPDGQAGHAVFGDTYPRIAVTGECFRVKAYDCCYYTYSDDISGVLELTYNRKGKLLHSERRKDLSYRFSRKTERSAMDQLFEEQFKAECKADDVTYVIPDSKPYLIKVIGETFEEIELEWNREPDFPVLDAVIQDGDCFLLVGSEFGQHYVDEQELWLHRFSMETRKEMAAARLHTTLASGDWGYRTISNLIVHDGYCYVAVVSEGSFGYRLELAIWDGISDECFLKTLTRKIDIRTSLHMANIGDDLLITYHYPGAPSLWSDLFQMKRDDAKVYTIPLKLKGKRSSMVRPPLAP